MSRRIDEEMMSHLSLFTTHSLNRYGISTFDALFKYILREPSIQPSFFHALAGLNITKATRIDDIINPIQELEALRIKFRDDKTLSEISASHQDQTASKVLDGFLTNLLPYFDELKLAFPNLRFNGMMDFVCELSNGEYAFVDIQLIPYDYWDKRALSYLAAFYGKQMREGGQWKDIKHVIGINILSGAQDSFVQWLDTPSQYKPQFRIQENLHRPSRYIDGIEIIQYSLMYTPEIIDKEKQDWLTLLNYAHYMTEEDLCREISTPAVLKAFEYTKLSDVSPRVLNLEELHSQDYDEALSEGYAKRYAKGYAQGYAKGYAKGYSESVLKMMCIAIKQLRKSNESDTKIKDLLCLTPHQFQDYVALMELKQIQRGHI